ncbi:capsular biosynthesis protein [Motilimonas cestriensis]|uniref:Capsular biosynthesis protein n=1 Tax=Motilimonas cestriensis TaxID=2742685 RepID=A0ABS8W7D1_9GAMM|nr:capsular biosynthesis protein [Motilimonas cestriensis]MCE2594012.1 capsular biosynthesis protein [Motilimonas cestriensis]
MFLIMSAAYISQELESEFGTIPPAFLPLGNKRLFQHQVNSAPTGKRVFLTVPESYAISDFDRNWLRQRNVTILAIPDDISLGASLISALNLVGHNLDEPLSILFGDTLIPELPSGEDIVAISEVENSYNWAVVTHDETELLKTNQIRSELDSANVVSGYFKCSQPKVLIKALIQAHWDFNGGMNLYHAHVGLTTVRIDNWLDFGHVNTYYRSKAKYTTQRAFNELTITPRWIEKSSHKSIKIQAEAHWFEQLPPMMRTFTPQFLGATHDKNAESCAYRLEYLHYTALNELYVFSALPDMVWRRIINGCLHFIDECLFHSAPSQQPVSDLATLFAEKTQSRLAQYCKTQQLDPEKKWHYNQSLTLSLTELDRLSQDCLPKIQHASTVMHGDFCFSNILYDFRTNSIKTIDPRGLNQQQELTIFGDVRYDLAKLSHSIIGLYDWIIAGYFNLTITENIIDFALLQPKELKATQQFFMTQVEQKYGLTRSEIYAMQIQLFLSMLPLHADDKNRQNALLANAFRLYQLLAEELS